MVYADNKHNNDKNDDCFKSMINYNIVFLFC